MIFGSVCSGIGGAELAWRPLGWRCAWSAEIEPFSSAVLAERFPHTPNLGDFTKIGKETDCDAISLLVAGTPCQSFSCAGRRGGLDDPRGNLTLEWLALVARLRPRWLVWENVPGVLSIDKGRTFGVILGTLAELGYGFAYRVLDAQHFGVPQRRRRVFLVGYLGDWRPPAAVLFERSCLSGNPPPRRETREETAGMLGGGSSERGWCNDTDRMTFVADTVRSHPRPGSNSLGNIAHSLRSEGFDASEDGTGRGIPIVASPITGRAADTSNAGNNPKPRNLIVSHPVARGARPPTLVSPYAVRRLTVTECERLMGFPDHWTAISYRGKPAADGPRYRALGNALAVPVVRWIGERIQKVEWLRYGLRLAS